MKNTVLTILFLILSGITCQAQTKELADSLGQLGYKLMKEGENVKAAKAWEQALPLVEKHAREMGVKPQSITYKPMISRWGLCNVKTRTICFSAYLLLLPEWCIEHVVVHELCHLLEPSHNVRFHTLMDRYFPRWKEARKETRRICKC